MKPMYAAQTLFIYNINRQPTYPTQTSGYLGQQKNSVTSLNFGLFMTARENVASLNRRLFRQARDNVASLNLGLFRTVRDSVTSLNRRLFRTARDNVTSLNLGYLGQQETMWPA